MASELSAGQFLGPYELLVCLGRGGMASVWVARARGTSRAGDRLVAVKAILPELAPHAGFRAMFLAEGQLVSSIDHPNVVKVHDVGEERGALYMAMDWIEGDSLRTLIKEANRRRPIPAELAVKIIADTAAGLHAAHELRGSDGELRNLVHCDVSPHNILIGLDGRARLVDFGVANATRHGDLSADDKIKGKFGYMSPEQARAETLDRRSDVFALGIVLFELLTGNRLFRGENPAHTLELVKEGPIPDPSTSSPGLPPALCAIVQKALARDLDERFQSAEELRVALSRYLMGERILVAHTSVGKLVRRVLGERIELSRQELREALTVSDGIVAAGLVPDAPAHAEGTLSSEPPRPRAEGSRSEAPIALSIATSNWKSMTPPPQALERESRGRSAAGPAFFALLGLSAAAAALYVENRPTRPSAEDAMSVPGDSVSAPLERKALAAKVEEASVSIDSIPLAAPGKKARGRRRSEPAGEGAPAENEAENEAEAEPGADDDSRAVDERPNPYVTEAAPGAAEERAAGEPSSSVLASESPINAGAALGALGKAAEAVSVCKRPDGPAGRGAASVTFAPDGAVRTASVSAPFSGTAVGTCVVNAFRGAHVPAFSGNAVTLSKSFIVPE